MIRTEFVNTLFKLVNILRNTGEHIFSPFHLTTRTYAIMNMIHSGINTSQKIFSGVYGTRSSLMKRLRVLEDQGYVTRKVSEEDGRILVFSLTKKGYDVLDAIQPIYQKAIVDMFSHIPEMDIQIAQKVFIRMIVDIEASQRK